MRRSRPNICAFTLIEMIVVLAVLSILASVALPMVELEVRRAKEQELRRALWELRDAIDAFKAAYDEGRIARSPTSSGYPPGLGALVSGVADVRQPGKTYYFLRRLPRDPMQPDLPPDRAWGLRSYASGPDDPQPGDDVYDVYTRAPGTGLDGRPYRLW